MNDFGKRLKELRTQNQLSQKTLAIKLGVTPQAVSKWEKGISTPDLSVLIIDMHSKHIDLHNYAN